MVKRDRKGKEKPQCPKGTGGGGRPFCQHCSQQSRVGTGTSVLPCVSEPRAVVPESCCCTPTGPLMLNQASPGSAGCVLMLTPVWAWWPGHGLALSSRAFVVSPRGRSWQLGGRPHRGSFLLLFHKGWQFFCEGLGSQCLQLHSSAGLCPSCSAVRGSHALDTGVSEVAVSQ